MGLLSRLLLCAFLVFAIVADDWVAASVRHPPVITKYTHKNGDHFELSGTSALILECIVDGHPAPTVEWVQRESYYTGTQPKETIRKDGVIEKDSFNVKKAGVYQCVATNQFGTDISNHISLRWAHNGEFDKTADPKIITGTVGKPLRIPCETIRASLPTALYRFVMTDSSSVGITANTQKKEVDMGWRISSDINDGAQYFAHIIPEDKAQVKGTAGFYMCQLVNPATQSTIWGGDIDLKIQAGNPVPIAPTVPNTLPQSQTVHVMVGETLKLFCFFYGYPTILLTWMKDDMPNGKTTPYDGTHFIAEDVKNDKYHNGVYVCEGSLKDTAKYPKTTYPPAIITYTVIVDVPPTFKVRPENTNLTVGSKLEFECEALGNPLPEIEWRVNNVAVTPQNKGQRVKYSQKGNKGTYTMDNVQKGDANHASDLRVVTCYAKNTLTLTKKGVPTTTTIGELYGSGYLNVFNALKITQGPSDVTLEDKNQVIFLDCNVTSDPGKMDFTVSWFKNNIRLNMIENKIVQLDNNTLVIYSKKYDKWSDIVGNYTCQAMTTNPAQLVTMTAVVDADSSGAVGGVTTAGGANLWWIAVVVAIILIIIILLLIFCCIKRNKGESYPVDENERKTGNIPENDLHKPEHGGFSDYQRSEKDPIGGSRASLDGSIKPLDSDDDDNDSMAEYGEFDTGKFNEDGSFIGQYIPPDKNKNTRDVAPPPYSSRGGSDTMV